MQAPVLLRCWEALSAADREKLDGVLYWDMSSEYDARFLHGYLQCLGLPLSEAFWRRERQWADDEEVHYRGFLAVNEVLFGRGESCLADRRPDFGPIAHLFEDEFAIACLLAYDELATVRGFRGNLGLYDRLGAELGAFVRRVIGDEGRHYGSFMLLVRERFADRLAEAPDVVARIRRTEGLPYASTFVLDHDEDDLYTDAVLDEAQRILLRHLAAGDRAVPA